MHRTCFFSLEITLAYDLKLKRNLVKDRLTIVFSYASLGV